MMLVMVIYRFCIGDRFYLHNNLILCEYDYAEQRTAVAASNNNNASSAVSSSSTSVQSQQHRHQLQQPGARSCLDPGQTPAAQLCPAAATQMKRFHQLQQQHPQQQQQHYLHPHPPLPPPHQRAATMDGCVNW